MNGCSGPCLVALGAARRWTRAARAALLAILVGCGAGPPLETYTDLLARAAGQQVREGAPLRVLVWGIAGDHRPTLFQHPPSRVSLGSLPTGEDCRVHFGIGVKESVWSQSDGVRFRLWLERDGGLEPLYEELLDTAAGEPAWHDRGVALPRATGGAQLVLETDAGPAGDRSYDHAGWAAPHIVCRLAARRPRSAGLSHPHVVLISIDTLRADRLGAYGHWRPTSPVLDRLAGESVVFERAFSPAPWTLPAHASMFTGLYPHQHGAGHAAPFVPLPDGAPTLAETLGRAGYRTLAFTAGGIMSRRNGLDRGFERWREWTRASLRSVLPALFAEIGTAPDAPLFVFLHTYDVHGPYAEAPLDLAFETDIRDPRLPAPEWQRIRGVSAHDYLKLARFDGLAEVVAAYDSGIRAVDAQLGRLFERLRAIGLYEDALIVVTSDHGESLYEDALYIGHSYSLREAEIRVPLLVRLPGAAQRGRSSVLTSLVDLMPLILGAAGVAPDAALAGADPLREAQPDRLVRGEATHTGARYVRSARFKLIGAAHPPGDPASRLPAPLRPRFEPGPKLYDLERDPAEQHDLLGAGPEVAELPALEARLAAAPPPGFQPGDPEPDAETRDALRALGYVE